MKNLNKKCIFCKKEIPLNRYDKLHPKIKYCSDKCIKRNHYFKTFIRSRVSDKPCLVCDKDFERKSKFHPKAKYCSKECGNKADYENNKKSYFQNSYAWRKRNPEKVREIYRNNYKKYSVKKRAQKKVRIRCHISLKTWKEICNRFGNMCVFCEKKGDWISMSADHTVPLAIGGTNEWQNIQPACLKCNQSKGARWVG